MHMVAYAGLLFDQELIQSLHGLEYRAVPGIRGHASLCCFQSPTSELKSLWRRKIQTAEVKEHPVAGRLPVLTGFTNFSGLVFHNGLSVKDEEGSSKLPHKRVHITPGLR